MSEVCTQCGKNAKTMSTEICATCLVAKKDARIRGLEERLLDLQRANAELLQNNIVEKK